LKSSKKEHAKNVVALQRKLPNKRSANADRARSFSACQQKGKKQLCKWGQTDDPNNKKMNESPRLRALLITLS
jgi:hypothetical protein